MSDLRQVLHSSELCGFLVPCSPPCWEDVCLMWQHGPTTKFNCFETLPWRASRQKRSAQPWLPQRLSQQPLTGLMWSKPECKVWFAADRGGSGRVPSHHSNNWDELIILNALNASSSFHTWSIIYVLKRYIYIYIGNLPAALILSLRFWNSMMVLSHRCACTWMHSSTI